jgi:hypothetical protein
MFKITCSKETIHIAVVSASKQINWDNQTKVKHEAANISGIKSRYV